MQPFALLGLSAPLVRAVGELGFEEPTPIQAAAIPAILAGRDVLGSAQTGSGKTAAFVLPMLQKLSVDRRSSEAARSRAVRGLVLVPTRELAVQIGKVIADCGRHLPAVLKTCVAVGGLSINPQMLALRGGADIVVATPGRLLDLIDHNALHLSRVEILVLDEADRLLSFGFTEELERVLALLDQRQNLLFSATLPVSVQVLAEQHLHDPLRLDMHAGATHGEPLILQRAIEVDAPRRTMLLRHLLETHAWSSVLVFVASRHTADHLVDKLQRARISAAAIHGGLSQGARTEALEAFKTTSVKVLIATDLAARGLDIASLPAVVNYDLPRSADDYLHRIGRTARAGESGMAVTFIGHDTAAHFRLIEKRHHLQLHRERVAGFEPTEPVLQPGDPLRDQNGGVKGKRKSKKDKLREAAALGNGPRRPS